MYKDYLASVSQHDNAKTKNFCLLVILLTFAFLMFTTQHVYAAWDITHAWDTGDINTRVTSTTVTIDKAHDGTPFIIAPVQHGVKCFDEDGNLQWTYTGITNGYDVRDLAVGDLNGTGYNDSVVVASGYYSTTTDGKFAILDKDGNVLQLFKGTDFATPPSSVQGVAVDGTDIYVGTNLGVTKFVKSGSTWTEDTSGWNKSIGNTAMIKVADMGNGKRIYVAGQSANKIYSFEPDGTEEWAFSTGNSYQDVFAIGKTDSSTSGLQMVVPVQTNLYVLDKDGNQLWSSGSSLGTNVRSSVTLYDNNGDGQDEIYYTDMGQNVYVLERSGSSYVQQYLLSGAINSGQYAGLAHYDINDDGSDEIFIYTTDGHLLIYDKTLSTQLKDITLGHGQAGSYYIGYQFRGNGIVFADTDGDGHADVIITGATGYVDVYRTSGFPASDSNSNPKSSNYTVRSYSFGSGGVAGAASTNYMLNGVSGELSLGELMSSDYKLGGGLSFATNVDVPPAPTVSNPGGTSYNMLSVTLAADSNPSTTEYAIALSPDGFASTTEYVQADDTPGSTPVWQTASVWGASGFDVIGLSPDTTYSFKVAAIMGKFSQSAYGPVATGDTGAGPSFTLSISPNTVNYTSLPAGTIETSPDVTINVDTNATYGGYVYIYGANAGLTSAHAGHTIDSATGNLASLDEGFGGQINATSETSGGPLATSSPYGSGGTTVGVIDTTVRNILTTSASITGGSATLVLSAKSSATTPAANDYTETLTVIGAASF